MENTPIPEYEEYWAAKNICDSQTCYNLALDVPDDAPKEFPSEPTTKNALILQADLGSLFLIGTKSPMTLNVYDTHIYHPGESPFDEIDENLTEIEKTEQLIDLLDEAATRQTSPERSCLSIMDML
ncbi:MAG: hypothetical protein K9L59_07540 [Desulfobacterales bacterium]|nr:hypothetical protein [Desulfobacterales bacterium]